MAEEKKYEYIVEFEPYCLQNDEKEVCFKSKSVRQLVRCKDCNHWVPSDRACTMLGWWSTPPDGYCHYGDAGKI